MGDGRGSADGDGAGAAFSDYRTHLPHDTDTTPPNTHHPLLHPTTTSPPTGENFGIVQNPKLKLKRPIHLDDDDGQSSKSNRLMPFNQTQKLK